MKGLQQELLFKPTRLANVYTYMAVTHLPFANTNNTKDFNHLGDSKTDDGNLENVKYAAMENLHQVYIELL